MTHLCDDPGDDRRVIGVAEPVGESVDDAIELLSEIGGVGITKILFIGK